MDVNQGCFRPKNSLTDTIVEFTKKYIEIKMEG